MRTRNRSVAWWVAPAVALLLLLVAGTSGLNLALHGDTIYLKNGSAIDGTVLGTHEGMVILRIGNVGRIEISEKEIENIERNDRTGYVDPGRGRGDVGKEPIIGPAEPDPAEESGGEEGSKEAGDGSGDEPIDEALEKEIERLTQDLTRQKTRVRVRAERKLNSIGKPMLPYLRKYSHHPFVRTRVAVFRLYKNHAEFAVAEACLEGLEDEERFVRKLAWQALKRIAKRSWSFPWDDEVATKSQRDRALDRWRKWFEEESQRRAEKERDAKE